MSSMSERFSDLGRKLRVVRSDDDVSLGSESPSGKGAFPETIWRVRSELVSDVSVFPLEVESKGKNYFRIRLYLEDESLPSSQLRRTGTASLLELDVEEKEVPTFVKLSGRRIRIKYLTWNEKEQLHDLTDENIQLREEILELRKKLKSVNSQLTFIVSEQAREDRL